MSVPLPEDPQERAELLREQFAGLWIAVWEDEVVAAATTIDSVFESLDRQHLPEATVAHIPDPKFGVAVGLG